MEQPLRILLVDDLVLFRKGISSLLSNRKDLVIVGEANNGLEAIERARQTMPDVILMDIDMPKCNGIEAVKQIKQELPDIDIIMLTVSEVADDLFQAVKYGASGYLLKSLEPHKLYELFEGLRQGEAPISGLMATKILQEFQKPTQNQAHKTEEVDALTPREIEVLEQVTTGASNKEIAETLVITENTVKIHLRSILEKLHVNNRVQAAVHAVRKGLVDDKPTAPQANY